MAGKGYLDANIRDRPYKRSRVPNNYIGFLITILLDKIPPL